WLWAWAAEAPNNSARLNATIARIGFWMFVFIRFSFCPEPALFSKGALNRSWTWCVDFSTTSQPPWLHFPPLRRTRTDLQTLEMNDSEYCFRTVWTMQSRRRPTGLHNGCLLILRTPSPMSGN